MPHTLQLYMWGYQPHFRSSLERVANQTLEAIGFEAEARALLVGVRKPGSSNPNLVCIEPEFETWPLSLFEGVLAAIEKAYPEHELQNVFYGDEPSMRDKPENIRRDVVRTEIVRCLKPFDTEFAVTSFCGWPRQVGDYYVVPVLQVPVAALQRYPRLRTDKIYLGRYRPRASFVDVCIMEVLDNATEELELPEPGRGIHDHKRSSEEVVRRAARTFLRTPLLATARDGKPEEGFALDLFKSLNAVSSHMYESAAGIGRMLFVNPDSPKVDYALRFPHPIYFRDARWVRKLLQMAIGPHCLIANGGGIFGLGTLHDHDTQEEDAFWVDFLGHYQWNMRLGAKVILQSQFGEPTLLIEAISEERFKDNFLRVIAGAPDTGAEAAWHIMQTITNQPKGCMVVFAEDAAPEARRLSRQGMLVVPAPLTSSLLTSASRIDGSILCDTDGICHAMGVILDGAANANCTPARGSRYNSAIRYVFGSQAARLAIVKSEDGVLDIIPLLRPRISRKAFTDAITALENADMENYYKPRLFLDDHRFYALPEDCRRINAALDRLDAMPTDVGIIRLGTARFSPNPAMNYGYYY